jgi:glycosyltransferase involved in cell wall biosynthesis
VTHCYELIIVDNGSTDGTRGFLSHSVTGITLLANDRNYGGAVSRNLGASHAVGRYLVFLDSDTLVHPSWLAPLVARLEEDETVAAVGPRILNLDGSLQLAGALLTRSGAIVSYGVHDDPDRPEYTFRRDVDFCSTACVAVRRWAFNDVGGFDPAFVLIYFEGPLLEPLAPRPSHGLRAGLDGDARRQRWSRPRAAGAASRATQLVALRTAVAPALGSISTRSRSFGATGGGRP